MNSPEPSPGIEPRFTINGVERAFGPSAAHTTALEWLRENRLTGAKEGCAEGECGACAILVAQKDRTGGSSWCAVNSCLVPMAALDGQELVTAEGLGNTTNMHPVQAAMASAGGSQCGYCTPGFVCSMAAEFYRKDRVAPQAATLEQSHGELGANGFDLHALSGNLCRCTGYRPIRDAAYSLGEVSNEVFARRRDTPAPEYKPTALTRSDGRFVRATTLAQTVTLLNENPESVLVAGSTDWGVEVNIRARRAPLVIAIEQIPELGIIEVRDHEIEIGAAVPLSELELALNGKLPLLAQLIPQFASRLIRNRATLGGNLGTGSPIGDGAPALLALEAQIVLASARGQRVVALADYFTGYRTNLKQADELITSLRIPRPLSNLTAFHKIAKRRFDDISSVAVAFSLQIDGHLITKAKIGLGGVAATPLRAVATEEFLTSKPWTHETITTAAAILGKEGTPMSDHRASSGYRSMMLANALLKLYAENHVIQEARS
ncbi:xanthine dehydrogenase small subunit [Arthrobacter alpinus]|uniref:xanthine dehydrogenase small subunit n=1 Tax=Arthrobacter alpinus TaxID=656366 RepID=UPI00073A89A6|nr:FAD binding domain-containing protein [Arthrobacter alpinus]ALV44617.1 xanthine dehydrogenase small subunit [Arthrobacter alpinus]